MSVSSKRVPYDAPPTLPGLLGRFYPLIVPLLSLEIGTEIGAAFGRFDPRLGKPLLPLLYGPLAGWHWFLQSVTQNVFPYAIASEAFGITVVIFCLATFAYKGIDFVHGRNWGPLNPILGAFMLLGDLRTFSEGLPPSFTWWGSGGIVERESNGAKNPRAKR